MKKFLWIISKITNISNSNNFLLLTRSQHVEQQTQPFQAIDRYRSLHLKMYNKYFNWSIFGFLHLLYVCPIPWTFPLMGRLFHKILVNRKSRNNCGGSIIPRTVLSCRWLDPIQFVLSYLAGDICPLTFSCGTDLSIIWFFVTKQKKWFWYIYWSRHVVCKPKMLENQSFVISPFSK